MIVALGDGSRHAWSCLWLTQDREQHRHPDKAVGRPQHHNEEIHAEVEHLEDLRVCKGQHADTYDLGEGDARQHLKEYHLYVRGLYT